MQVVLLLKSLYLLGPANHPPGYTQPYLEPRASANNTRVSTRIFFTYLPSKLPTHLQTYTCPRPLLTDGWDLRASHGAVGLDDRWGAYSFHRHHTCLKKNLSRSSCSLTMPINPLLTSIHRFGLPDFTYCLSTGVSLPTKRLSVEEIPWFADLTQWSSE